MLQKNANELFGQHNIWCWCYRISILWCFLLHPDLKGDLRAVSFCDVSPDHKVQIFPAWLVCYKLSYLLFITYHMDSAATDTTDLISYFIEGCKMMIISHYFFIYQDFSKKNVLSPTIWLPLSRVCMLLGSLSRHNKNLEWRTLKPLGGSQLSEDRPCYSSQVSNGLCYSY